MQKNIVKKGLIIATIFLFITVSFQPVFADDNVKKSSVPIDDGNWLYVGGSGEGNYTKIQDAIDNASKGDTINVYNGTYYERININKTLLLIGIKSESGDKPVVDADLTGAVFQLRADGCIVDGFVSKNAGKEFNDERACFYIRAKDCTVRNCDCTGDSYNAFRIDTQHVADRTLILNNTVDGSDMIEGVYQPFETLGCSDCINITGNIFTDLNYCIDFNGGTNHTIYGNYITRSRGILVIFGGHNKIIENTITNCWNPGIQLTRCIYECQILRNNVISCGGDGIFLQFNEKEGHIIEDNYISSNGGKGIELYRTGGCKVIGNTIVDNGGNGIETGLNQGNLIENNFIANNSGSGIYVEVSELVISGNIICNNSIDGIYADERTVELDIKGNIIDGNKRYGINLYCSGIDRLTYNHISNSQYGIYIKHSSLNIIVNNIIDGIYLNESNFDYICRNNFIGKNQDKYFLNSYGNIWFRNYWGEPRILPKFIKGEFIGKRVVTWYEFDLRPAIKPFDIE